MHLTELYLRDSIFAYVAAMYRLANVSDTAEHLDSWQIARTWYTRGKAHCRENDRLHTLQPNGFSPVWALRCLARCSGLWKVLAQNEHFFSTESVLVAIDARLEYTLARVGDVGKDNSFLGKADGVGLMQYDVGTSDRSQFVRPTGLLSTLFIAA